MLLIVAAVLGWNQLVLGQDSLPDFAHPDTPHVMGKNPFAFLDQLDQLQTVTARLGEHPLLVVLLEFPDSAHNPEHTPEHFADLVFGPDPSVTGYYKEVSYSQYSFSNAGVVGWYTVPQPVSMYFGDSQTLYTQLAAFAAQAAAADGFPFEQFDLNGDGEIRQDELVVLVVVADHPPIGLPQLMSTRFDHMADQGVISPEGIEVDTFAVRVEENLYTNGREQPPTSIRGPYISYYAHELAHAALSLPDLYNDEFGEDPSTYFSIMATAGTAFQTHLDPWAKIHLGWIRPVVVTTSGWYKLRSVERSSEAYVLYDPAKGEDEYFILENRWPLHSIYETQGSNPNLLDRGLAIWHITEYYDDQPFDFLKGRKMIGMKWAAGADSLASRPFHALWDGAETVTAHNFTDDSVPRNARWADGGPSGFRVMNLPDAGPEMEIYIDVPGHLSETPIVSPAAFLFSAPDGVVSPPQALRISNGGERQLKWSVSADADWIRLGQAKGNVAIEGTLGPGEAVIPWIEVSVDAARLAPGESHATIRITSDGGDVAVPVTVSDSAPLITSDGIVNAASFSVNVAPGAILSLFGHGLAPLDAVGTTVPLPTELSGTQIEVTDSSGVTRLAELFGIFNAGKQINFFLSSETAPGEATLTVKRNNGTSASAGLQVNQVAPGVFFVQNANAQLVALANVLRISDGMATTELTFSTVDFSLVPIDLGSAGDQVFLSLFVTGIQFATGVQNMSATIDGAPVPVFNFAGDLEQFIGLGQVNIGPMPRVLIGRGAVEVILTVDGVVANTVLVSFL